jgi:heme-degrading monooxygenase HmoA
MILAAVYFDTTDPDGFLSALGLTGALFEEVQGFHGFEVRRGIEDPNRIFLTVDWDSVEDHTAWQKANVKDFLAALDPFLSGPPDIKHFAPLNG